MAGNSKNLELTPKQRLLIDALLGGNSMVVAAKAAHCGERTAHTWFRLPHVQAAYKAVQDEVFNDALQLLKLNVREAIEGIENISKSEDVQAPVRLSAYKIRLEQAIAIHKTQALEQEVAELRELVKDIRNEQDR